MQKHTGLRLRMPAAALLLALALSLFPGAARQTAAIANTAARIIRFGVIPCILPYFRMFRCGSNPHW